MAPVQCLLLKRSTRWFQIILFFTLGFILASFLDPWAPKWRTGTEKEASRKHIKKHLQKCLKIYPRRSQIQTKSRQNPDIFLHFFRALGSDRPRDPIFIDFLRFGHLFYAILQLLLLHVMLLLSVLCTFPGTFHPLLRLTAEEISTVNPTSGELHSGNHFRHPWGIPTQLYNVHCTVYLVFVF